MIPVPAPQSVPSVGNYTWMDSEALPSAKRPRTATTRSGGSSATFQDEHLIAPPAHISHHETAPAPVHEDPLEALLSRDVGAAAAFTGASGSAAPPPTFREVVDGPAHPERKGVSAVPSEVDLKGMMMQMKRCPQPAELDMDDIEALFSASCHEGLPAPAQVPTFPMSRCPTREEMACLFEGFDFTDI